MKLKTPILIVIILAVLLVLFLFFRSSTNYEGLENNQAPVNPEQIYRPQEEEDSNYEEEVEYEEEVAYPGYFNNLLNNSSELDYLSSDILQNILVPLTNNQSDAARQNTITLLRKVENVHDDLLDLSNSF